MSQPCVSSQVTFEKEVKADQLTERFDLACFLVISAYSMYSEILKSKRHINMLVFLFLFFFFSLAVLWLYAHLVITHYTDVKRWVRVRVYSLQIQYWTCNVALNISMTHSIHTHVHQLLPFFNSKMYFKGAIYSKNMQYVYYVRLDQLSNSYSKPIGATYTSCC